MENLLFNPSNLDKEALVYGCTAAAFLVGAAYMYLLRRKSPLRSNANDAEALLGNATEEESEDSEDDQIEGLSESALSTAPADWGVTHAPFKMLMLVNQELFDATGKQKKMTAGKTAAQCGHAVLGAYKRGLRRSPGAIKAWEWTGQAKIAVKCPTEAELMTTRAEAAKRGISFYLVRDAGHTQIAPDSKTVLAIGPAPVAVLDEFTRHFKLY